MMRAISGWCLAVVAVLASACGSPAKEPPALESHLSCAAGLTVSMVADFDDSGSETRSPEEIAKDYGAAVAGPFSGQRKVVYKSADRVDISFTEANGSVQGVLSLRNFGLRGWRMDHAANCP